MKQRQIFRIIACVAGLFILYAFNQIIVLAVAPFVLVNLLNAVLVAAPYYLIMKRGSEEVIWFDVAFLILVFFTGLNLALRTKFYFFLGLLHGAFLLFVLFHTKAAKQRLRLLVGLEAGMALVSLAIVGCILGNIINMYVLLAASVVLCAMQIASFRLIHSSGLMTS